MRGKMLNLNRKWISYIRKQTPALTFKLEKLRLELAKLKQSKRMKQIDESDILWWI